MNDLSATAAWADSNGAFLRGFRHRTVIIKADDLGREANLDCWWRLLDGLEDRGIALSAGVVPSSLRKHRDGALTRLVLQLEQGGHEVWNHSHSHRDFAQMSFGEQVEDLRLSQEGIGEIFGARPLLFGAPFNSMNDDTIRAVEENSDFTGLYFARFPTRLDTLPYGNLCPPEFVKGYYRQPDFAEFLPRYKRRQTERPIVLQVHPPAWTRHGLNEFLRIVDWLIAGDWQFVTFGEHAEYLRWGEEAAKPAMRRAALLAADEAMTHAFGTALHAPDLPPVHTASLFFDRYTSGTAHLTNLLRSAGLGAAPASADGPLGLDIGCGAGNWSIAYAGLSAQHRAVGIDTDAYLVGLVGDAAKGVPMAERVSFREGSIFDIPAADGAFDHVICNNLINYFPAEKTLPHLRRVLRFGGLAVVGAQNRGFWLKGYFDSLQRGDGAGALRRIDQLGYSAARRCGLPAGANYASIWEGDEFRLVCDVNGLRPQPQGLAIGERAGHFLGTPLFDYHVLQAGSPATRVGRRFVDADGMVDFAGVAELHFAGATTAFLEAVEDICARTGRSAFDAPVERLVASAVAVCAESNARPGEACGAIATRHPEFLAACRLHLRRDYAAAAAGFGALAAAEPDRALLLPAAMARYASGDHAVALSLIGDRLPPQAGWSDGEWLVWLTLVTAAEGVEPARAGLRAYLEWRLTAIAQGPGSVDLAAQLADRDLNMPMQTSTLALASLQAAITALG